MYKLIVSANIFRIANVWFQCCADVKSPHLAINFLIWRIYLFLRLQLCSTISQLADDDKAYKLKKRWKVGHSKISLVVEQLAFVKYVGQEVLLCKNYSSHPLPKKLHINVYTHSSPQPINSDIMPNRTAGSW